MDELTLVLTFAAIAILTSSILLMFIWVDRKHRDFTYMIFGTISLTICYGFFYFDIRSFLNGEHTFLWPFFTFFFLSFSLGMLSKSLSKLYKVQEATSMWVFMGLVFLVSTAGALANYFNSFIARNFVFALMTMLPFIIILHYKKHSVYQKLPSIITKEIYFLFIVFVVKGIDYLLFYEPIHFTDVPDKEIFFIIVINLTVIAMYISYIVEENIIKIHEIDQKNKLLNETLEEVKHVSEHDQLTGLYNRRKINETLEKYHEKADEALSKYAILIGDIDKFKLINDTYGHQFGDQVIQFVANALKLFVKEGATVGR